MPACSLGGRSPPPYSLLESFELPGLVLLPDPWPPFPCLKILAILLLLAKRREPLPWCPTLFTPGPLNCPAS